MNTLAFVQNIGTPGLVIILIAILLIFGPKNLPALGRSLGRALREFRDAASKLGDTMADDDSSKTAKPRETLEGEAQRSTPPPKKAEAVGNGDS